VVVALGCLVEQEGGVGELAGGLVVGSAVPEGAAAAEPVWEVVVGNFQALFGRERFITGIQAVILYQIATNKIDLHQLIATDAGNASLSRFQFLLFTFILGAGLLHLTLKGSGFRAVDDEILMLLGISGASYAIGKSLDKPTPRTVTTTTAASSDPSSTAVVSKTTQTGAVG
jgi:hypothetical protein